MRWLTVRSLLSWLLLVVIPLQGFAAGSAQGCHTVSSGAHPAVVAHATTAIFPLAHSEHTPADTHSSAVHAVHFSDDAAAPLLADARVDTAYPGDHTPAKCKACSPCCVSALPSAAGPLLRPLASAFMLFHEPLNHHRSTVPNGLERPPRSLLG